MTRAFLSHSGEPAGDHLPVAARDQGAPFRVGSPVSRYEEEVIMRRFIDRMKLPQDEVLLDVGSGYGRKVKWLRSQGLRVRGVDINPELVAAVRRDGFDCMTVAEFESTTETYGAMLMSHIVEHFNPSDLLAFIDGYLDRLRPGGYLIITTPALWADFYCDFDHIRPYYPQAINTVFCKRNSQVQYHARNSLQLLDIGLRRRPRHPSSLESLVASLGHRSLFQSLSIAFSRRLHHWAFRLSGGVLCGETTGWLGLYCKCNGNMPLI